MIRWYRNTPTKYKNSPRTRVLLELFDKHIINIKLYGGDNSQKPNSAQPLYSLPNMSLGMLAHSCESYYQLQFTFRDQNFMQDKHHIHFDHTHLTREYFTGEALSPLPRSRLSHFPRSTCHPILSVPLYVIRHHQLTRQQEKRLNG